MKRVLACLLLLVGLFVSSCEEFEGDEGPDVRLTGDEPQVEVVVQQ